MHKALRANLDVDEVQDHFFTTRKARNQMVRRELFGKDSVLA